ncbi:hypothetical protein [Pseudomonas sp.]|uniref:hypothetical protein n=1 Tax=Pseudomonas sp. TaxID=306 RepID=UPI003C79049B
MLILKLAVVPLFIAAVTLAGRRWGAGFAGLLSGFPIVAGPIVVFVALENGTLFGALAATAAISAIAGLLVFGVTYCWVSIQWPWPAALACATGAWFVTATCLAALPAEPELALVIAGLALALTPHILPPSGSASTEDNSLTDLPYRMFTGAILTLAVTGAAATLGEVWSGLLAVFPIIGLVLSVFTHRTLGPRQVAHMYRGMVKGLYSFTAFFLVLAVLWPRVEFWTACATAVGAGVAVQAVVQGLLWPNKILQSKR